jgi:hypothetical protein
MEGPFGIAARLILEMRAIQNELENTNAKTEQELMNAYAFAYGELRGTIFMAAIDIRLLDPAAGLAPIDRKV